MSNKVNIKTINPKDYKGQYIETRDDKFYDKEAEITYAFISTDGDFCVEAYPDGLHMMWTYTPDLEGNIQIGRIHKRRIYERKS